MYFNPFRVFKNYIDHFVVFVTLGVFSKFEVQRYFCPLGCFGKHFHHFGGFRVISFIMLLYRLRVYFDDFENSYFVNKCFLVIYIDGVTSTFRRP